MIKSVLVEQVRFVQQEDGMDALAAECLDMACWLTSPLAMPVIAFAADSVREDLSAPKVVGF